MLNIISLPTLINLCFDRVAGGQSVDGNLPRLWLMVPAPGLLHGATAASSGDPEAGPQSF